MQSLMFFMIVVSEKIGTVKFLPHTISRLAGQPASETASLSLIITQTRTFHGVKNQLLHNFCMYDDMQIQQSTTWVQSQIKLSEPGH